MTAGAGRFAPSPTGDLHLGNLRTALVAWLFARSTDRRFLLRIEDLDRARAGSADRQLADLAAIGLDWDGPVVVQSNRTPLYDSALAELDRTGLLYQCFCTRREISAEIAAAASAPHGIPGHYPGTCRDLVAEDRDLRLAAGRRPALRLRADVTSWTVHDQLTGDYTGPVDDFVLRRSDGVVAYNLAVVVDDGEQGIDQVCRGDDLLACSPRQGYLGRLLGLPPVEYAHVPLALNPRGERLAKRDGAVTLAALTDVGLGPARVLTVLAVSLGLAGPDESVSPSTLLTRFDPAVLPRDAWTVDPRLLPLRPR